MHLLYPENTRNPYDARHYLSADERSHEQDRPPSTPTAAARGNPD